MKRFVVMLLATALLVAAGCGGGGAKAPQENGGTDSGGVAGSGAEGGGFAGLFGGGGKSQWEEAGWNRHFAYHIGFWLPEMGLQDYEYPELVREIGTDSWNKGDTIFYVRESPDDASPFLTEVPMITIRTYYNKGSEFTKDNVKYMAEDILRSLPNTDVFWKSEFYKETDDFVVYRWNDTKTARGSVKEGFCFFAPGSNRYYTVDLYNRAFDTYRHIEKANGDITKDEVLDGFGFLTEDSLESFVDSFTFFGFAEVDAPTGEGKAPQGSGWKPFSTGHLGYYLPPAPDNGTLRKEVAYEDPVMVHGKTLAEGYEYDKVYMFRGAGKELKLIKIREQEGVDVPFTAANVDYIAPDLAGYSGCEKYSESKTVHIYKGEDDYTGSRVFYVFPEGRKKWYTITVECAAFEGYENGVKPQSANVPEFYGYFTEDTFRMFMESIGAVN